MQNPIRRPLALLAAPLLIGAPLAVAQTTTFELSDVADPFGSTTQRFGCSLDVAGTTGVVGSDDGAWLVEREDTGRWALGAELVPFDFASSVGFGRAVAMDDDRIVVGAPEDDGATPDSGTIYLFERQPNGQWAPGAKLFLPSPVTGVEFGAAVAVDGDRVVVGAPRAQSPFGTNRSGVVHVFDRLPNGNWALDATLAVPSSDDDLRFGHAVDVEGDRIVVGAPFEELTLDAGRAFVFERGNDGSWKLEEELIPSVSELSDVYGWSIDLEGDVVAIGAPRQDGAQLDVGAVFVWGFANGVWKEEDRLEAQSFTLGDRNGTSVALAGDILYVGAIGENGVSTWTGATRRWQRLSGGAWAISGNFSAPSPTLAWYSGSALAVDDGMLLIGSPGDPTPVGATPGNVTAIYSYDTSNEPAPEDAGIWSGGCAGPIRIDANLPALIPSSDYAIETDAPGAFLSGLLIVGFGFDPAGPDLAGLGLAIYVDPFTAVPPLLIPTTSGADGTASTPLPLPSGGNLAGLVAFLQTVWIDPACPANPFGLSSSNALGITLGKP